MLNRSGDDLPSTANIFCCPPAIFVAAASSRKTQAGEMAIVPHLLQKGTAMRIIIAAVLIAGALLTAACNTVEGVGKDVSSAGDTVAKAAK